MSRPENSSWNLSVADITATGPEESIDRITRMATRLLGVPAGFLVIAEGETLVFKSEIGLPPAATLTGSGLRVAARYGALLRHVAGGHALQIDDVAADGRFAPSGLAEELGIGAFIGLPVGLPCGSLAGAFCVADARPRAWSAIDRQRFDEVQAVLAGELALRQEVKLRMQLEQRAFLMSREMEHRIKNSLSTVQAIILLSVRDGQSASEIRADLLERVASLAKTQSLLADRDGKGALFADIVAAELQHYGIGTNVWVDGPEVLVGKDDAVSLSMIIHELATNAAKHGALALRTKGGVAMRWEPSERDRQPALTFHWEEWFEGGPPKLAGAGTNGFGFGTELLETLVLRQMRGEMSRELTPGGLMFTASVRLSQAA
ncbi:HWE histidine kinase domain-containing protein [Aurantimonas sp. 22II-16-19i]|uniref:sensor histidine kinase n=1 Tax=Aurantimonas sp. 22II-16-19i TaxID=1317114 RepID=UPI0009F7BC01|nr:HWE histidine kinase domain-containing protein [Aurantimonas sp. 22II-16-19i]ORE97236.1 putative sensor histidine kinase (HWE family) with a GAF domain [Aurantimonas sp. 22II-16-19i]